MIHLVCQNCGKPKGKSIRPLCMSCATIGKSKPMTPAFLSALRSNGLKAHAAKRTHGRGNKFDLTYRTWMNMRNRCRSKRLREFVIYGARGIAVCERWNDFRNFVADMGEKPAGLSIDRINNGGHYEPGNCRWATPRQQAQNRRTTHATS